MAWVQVAVLSALNHTSLHPVCLYWGKESPMTTWLRGQGVTVILHEPAWIDKLKLAVRGCTRLACWHGFSTTPLHCWLSPLPPLCLAPGVDRTT